jgi:tetratricopeptide (TPR) repeat protein
MERVEKTVFLSYRRTNVPWALAIFQNLTQHGYDVFIDFNGVGPGDFESVILGNTTARAHFLVLLTPSALEHCNEPGDWLRREIETALDSKRNTIPLMMEGFDFGTPKIASQLTGKLAALKHYNGLSIPPEYFMEAMEKLRNKFLNVPLAAIMHPASRSAQQAATEQKAAAGAAPPVKEKELTAQQWFERGIVAAEMDEKFRLFSEAIRLKPDYVEALQNRSQARKAQGDLDGAAKDLEEAIRLNNEHRAVLELAGRGLETGDFDEVLRLFDEAIGFKPGSSTALWARGIVRQAKGDVDGAIEDLNGAIQIDPGYARAFYVRSLLRREKGDLEGAQRDHDEALRLGHKPPAA